MKAFASALLLAGAHAANGAIDFKIAGKSSMVSLSTKFTELKRYGKGSDSTDILIGNGSQVSWTVETDHANKNYILTLQMIAEMNTTLTVSKKTGMEIYQCWKNSALDDHAKDGLYGLSCHVFSVFCGTADNQAELNYLLYDMKAPKTVLNPAVDLASASAGGHMFYTGSSADNTKKGFKTTAMWDSKYAAKQANGAFTNTTTITLVKQSGTLAGANLKSVKATTVAYNTNGFKFTIDAVIHDTGTPTDFYKNGLKYSAAAMTLSQYATANAAAGIVFARQGAGLGAPISLAVKPTITSTLAKPHVDGLATDAFTYTTNSGMALTSGGTVSASNSTVQAFKVADAGKLGINVTHTATLASALTTVAIEVQQVTCLDIYTTAPAQYLCVLTSIQNATTKNGATTTYKIIHEVYSMDTDVKASVFSVATNELNKAAKNLNDATAKGALLYKATSNEVLVGEEATLKGMNIPDEKMSWPGGNYLSMDLKNMQAKVSFYGVTKKTGATSSGDNKKTVDAIKTGLASAFTGTAAKSNTTWATKVSETTALAVKTAAACTDPTEATCISKHPTKCSASGALSTVATVGAAIAALAMSF